MHYFSLNYEIMNKMICYLTLLLPRLYGWSIIKAEQKEKKEYLTTHLELPTWLSGKEPACQCRRCKRPCSSPGLGRSPGGGNGNPLQYSCLKNSMDRGVWRATVHRVAKSQTHLSTHTCNIPLAI